jgi:dipeptidase E
VGAPPIVFTAGVLVIFLSLSLFIRAALESTGPKRLSRGKEYPVKAAKPHMIAIGGAGFESDPENPALELYILARARKRSPSICFVPTASGDHQDYIAKFYAAFARHRCRPSHFPLFARTPDPRMLLAQDVIYVGGGNTKSMLAAWRDWQLPKFLRQAWRSGTVLAGISAGAICWFAAGVTDSWAGRLAPLPCLGWLPNACCPHYDSEKDRRPATHHLVAKGLLPETLALYDGAAAHFVGRKLLRVVTSRPDAAAYRVQRKGHRAIETPLPVTRLKQPRRSRE